MTGILHSPSSRVQIDRCTLSLSLEVEPPVLEELEAVQLEPVALVERQGMRRETQVKPVAAEPEQSAVVDRPVEVWEGRERIGFLSQSIQTSTCIVWGKIEIPLLR